MIHESGALPLPGRLQADLCVIGSGPGGLPVATLAAEAGLRVVLLEAGGFIPPGQMNQREEQMLPRLMWAGGSQTATDRRLRLLQGHGLGGSSLHNINLCKRVPDPILQSWVDDRGMQHLPLTAWHALYDEVEALLAVSEVPEARVSAHNRLLLRGAQALGWRHGPLKHNRTGCVGSGFCELGCAFDAKNNAFKVFLPRFIAAGGTALVHAQATHLEHRGGEVRAVRALALDPATREPRGELRVEAPLVCVSASATGTPALLLRSKVPDPGGETGRRLRIHPSVIVAGEFEERIEAWKGIPQSVEVTEFLDLRPGARDRTWIVPVFGHPIAVAALIPGHGEAHAQVMARLPHLGALTAMLHEESVGEVRPRGELGWSVSYTPVPEDRRELARGLERCARLLFAAGARRVLVPGDLGIELAAGEDPAILAARPVRGEEVDLSAVHPMASVPMGDDPRVAAVGSDGRHHHLRGLWLADGSLLPGSIGVPPQLSIYALGLHVGRSLLSAVGAAPLVPSPPAEGEGNQSSSSVPPSSGH